MKCQNILNYRSHEKWAFIRYCVFNVCNFLKCKIGLKGNRTKTLFICSLKKKLLLHKRINIKPPDRCCSLFFAYADSICCCHFVYFVFCKRNPTAKQNKDFAKVSKKKIWNYWQARERNGEDSVVGNKSKNNIKRNGHVLFTLLSIFHQLCVTLNVHLSLGFFLSSSFILVF